MQVLFGSRHDGLHIDPDTPNGYEWWYFDALSNDGKYALVAVFFLGSPMSPYYKAVAQGRMPKPRDWCGVFFSLHENVGGRWREMTYAYNLYRGGEFSSDRPEITVGRSAVHQAENQEGRSWEITIDEAALWLGWTRGTFRFTAKRDIAALEGQERTSGAASDQIHTWVCVAPDCAVQGTLTTAAGQHIDFVGRGYHDHNFGRLPWTEADAWYWARAHFPPGADPATAILYHTISPSQAVPVETTILLWNGQGEPRRLNAAQLSQQTGNRYGFRHDTRCEWEGGSAEFLGENGSYSEGPFYRRLPVRFTVGGTTALGIGEIFQPARLCGPIASRAIWTRMRRQS